MSAAIDKETILKYDVSGPRYTSYPTAPEWSQAVTADIYREKLRISGRSSKTLSVYIHIPFCESLCYFCACSKVIRKNEPAVADEYLQYLFKEIDLAAQELGSRKTVKQLHWGGGTPSYLNEDQIKRLFAKLVLVFEIDKTGEIAIEIDPRTVTFNKLKVLRDLGFNRISMGVQDFDERVQNDINRIQPFTQVQEVNDWCRQLKFLSINFDLIYGLPYQTRETFAKTMEQVIGLRPDRIALYSFAYVPWLSKPQNKFNLQAIAVRDEKLDIFLNSREQLINSGYQAIAMDHFALKTDEMAKAFEAGTLHRNFMGYTLKPADEFIGFGVSAIGFLEHTYIQNQKILPDYYASLGHNKLPIERGKVLSEDDARRQWVINSLMCQFGLDKINFQECFGDNFDVYFEGEAEHLARCAVDGLTKNSSERIVVTELGKIFVRNICMGFDWYLRQETAQRKFSKTI